MHFLGICYYVYSQNIIILFLTKNFTNFDTWHGKKGWFLNLPPLYLFRKSFIAPPPWFHDFLSSIYHLGKSWSSAARPPAQPGPNTVAVLVGYCPRTTDSRWLNPQFFAAQIQIPIPNKYLGFGYKDLVFVKIMK